VLGAAGAVAAAVATFTTVACRLVDPPDNYFDPNGVTSLVFYPDSDPPTNLVSVGDYLIYAHGSALLRIPKVGGGAAQQVRALADGGGGSIRSLAFDGQETIAYCDESGELGTMDTNTFEPAPDLENLSVTGCFDVAIDPQTLAYATSGTGADTQAFQVTRLTRSSGASQNTPLLDDGGFEYSSTALAIGGSNIFLQRGEGVGATFGVTKMGCRLVFTGTPTLAKLVAFDAPEGGVGLVARGTNDSLKHFTTTDPIVQASCCSLMDPLSCATPAAVANPGMPSDFTVSDNLLYFSQGAVILRQPLLPRDTSGKPTDAGSPPQTVATISGQSGGDVSIPDLVVDDSYVFFVVGTRILRAPLP
jgi:hypothetical protein